jgi:hypothetical protein
VGKIARNLLVKSYFLRFGVNRPLFLRRGWWLRRDRDHRSLDDWIELPKKRCPCKNAVAMIPAQTLSRIQSRAEVTDHDSERSG